MRQNSAPKSWFSISQVYCLKPSGSKALLLYLSQGFQIPLGSHALRQTSPIYCPRSKGSQPNGHTAADYLGARGMVLQRCQVPKADHPLHHYLLARTTPANEGCAQLFFFLSAAFQIRRHSLPYSHFIRLIYCHLHPSLAQGDKGEVCISRPLGLQNDPWR